MEKTSNKHIIIILLLAIIARIFSIYLYGDYEIDMEWGVMLSNLEENRLLSVRSVDGVPVPNIFMPPLYPIFLYAIKLIFQDSEVFLKATLIIQLILSIFSIFIIYKILQQLFSKKFSLLGTLIYSFFPLNIYAVSQISSITLQMFLINVFIFSFIKIFKNFDLKNITLFSTSSALLILLRGEFFVFVILSLGYLFLNNFKNLWKITGIGLLIIMLISPYLYRNYKIFGVITITKSSGYNLLKGNHPSTVVEGIGMFGDVGLIVPAVKDKMDKLKLKGPIKEHDLIKDKILMDQAIKFIKEDPARYLKLYIKKFVAFMFIDTNSNYPNYYSLPHIIPKVILSITSILGLILVFSLKFNIANYFVLFYLSNIGLFSFFFILPRYSLSLLTIQIILSLYCFERTNKT